MSIEQLDNREQTANYESIIQDIDALTAIEDPDKYKQDAQTYIDKRLSVLKKDANPRQMVGPGMKPHTGFISPDTDVSRRVGMDGLRLDDDSIYLDLISNIKEFKVDPGWQDKSTRQFIPTVVNYTIAKYFGGWQGDDRKGQKFYMDHTTSDSESFSMSELKNKSIAVCVERAAVAQNLQSFLGLQSEFATGECQLDPDQKPEFHAFNLISSDKGTFISDVTNPTIIKDKNGRMTNMMPVFYPLTVEQVAALKNKEKVTVTHHDFQEENGSNRLVESQRIYQITHG